MLNIKRITGRLVRTDGSEIAEVAVVLPLVFMLLLGIVWFGRAFNIYSTIQQAAQQGAITAARATCATCGDAAATVTTVDNAITAVMQASNLNASQIQLPASPPNCAAGQPCSACPSPPFPPPPSTGFCSSTANIYVCQNVQLNPTAGQPTQCGTVVSFQYPFQFNFPGTSLNMQQIILSAQAQSRMEN
ncbi:MAG TPA: TadE family protein [Terriglobales bacterium]|nr:TadE family protein [Terriglobales bacterium]